MSKPYRRRIRGGRVSVRRVREGGALLLDFVVKSSETGSAVAFSLNWWQVQGMIKDCRSEAELTARCLREEASFIESCVQ